MMYSRFGLTYHQAADLAKCAEAAQLAIAADKERRAKLQAEEDERVRWMMAAWMTHLQLNLPAKNKPPKTSFYSE